MTPKSPRYPILEKVEVSLDLRPGFIEALAEEDDWSFIVKSHALIETMLTQVLTTKNDPRLEKVFSKLTFSRGQSSKVKAAEALHLITEPTKDIIILFSEVRNKYVHNVKYVTADLVGYFQEMDPNVLQKYSGSLLRLFLTNPDKEDIDDLKGELVRSPKSILNLAVFVIMGSLLFELHPIEKGLTDKNLEDSRVLIFFVLLLGLIWQQRDSNNPKNKSKEGRGSN